MDQTVVRQGMAVEDFIRRMDKPPFEIIDGEIVLMSPNVAGHDYTLRGLFVLLYTHTRERELGEVFSEATFVLSNATDRNWVTGSREPDIMFFSATRFTAYIAATLDWRDRPFALVPDLVIEVVSPTDRMATVLKKVALYLEDGVQVVWVVNRMHQSITIYTLTDDPVTLSGDQILTGGELLPGFSTPIHALFED